jgi:SAM-dependent methyltransferase
MDPITQSLQTHYAKTFAEHGCTAAGVDWGTDASVQRRNESMLALVQRDHSRPRCPSLLDVGCGFGQLLDDAKASDIPLVYTGIDVVPEMIEAGQRRHDDALFRVQDAFDLGDERFDYLVCNGILTQKLHASQLDMLAFAKHMINHLYAHCDRGIAFNVMSSRVNFMADNLFYWSPVECTAFCMSELSSAVGLSHHHLPYEYTVYVYRPDESA